MRKIDIGQLSKAYGVRRLTADDAEMIYSFCGKNPQFYAYCGGANSIGQILADMQAAPPGIPMEQKYYIGYFEGSLLVAVMDLIDGYPSADCAYIGFFMMERDMQGKGIGSRIIAEALAHLKTRGFGRCRLGIDKGNPQSNHFWRKNGFEIIGVRALDDRSVLLAEKLI